MKRRYILSLSAIVVACIFIIMLFPAAAGGLSAGDKKREVTYKNTYERLIAEHGFIYGVNLPWFGLSSNRSQTFGENPFTGASASYDHTFAEQALTNIKAIGMTCVRSWVFTGWGGVTMDENGYITGLTDEFLTNIIDYLETAKKVGITLNLVIFPHVVQSTTEIDLAFQSLVNPDGRAAYIENALNPFLDAIKPYEDIIVALDLYCEPEADTQEKALVTYGTTMDILADFILAESAAVRNKLPNMPVLISAGQNRTTEFYNTLDLDFLGVDQYDNAGAVENIKDLNTIYPAWITECGAKNDKNYSEEFNTQNVLSFYENARSSGYKACFYWHFAGGVALSLTKNIDCSDLRMSAVSLHFLILDYEYERNNIDSSQVADKPVLLYNSNPRVVKWIGSRDAASYKLELRINDGDWQVVDDNIHADSVDNGFYLCSYSFEELEASGKYSYRVTSTTYDGRVARSDVFSCNIKGTSSAICAPEDNLFINNGFETGDLTGWKSTSPPDKVADIYIVEKGSVEDQTVHSGEYALHWKPNNDGKCFYQPIKVKKNTKYTLTFFAKASGEDLSPKACFSILSNASWSKTILPKNTFVYQDGWRMYSYDFNSGDEEEIVMYFWNGYGDFYLDDFYLFETPAE